MSARGRYEAQPIIRPILAGLCVTSRPDNREAQAESPSRASIRGGEYEGDSHVHDAIRCVACIVAAGILRVPRSWGADSPFADNRRHFFGPALLQGP